MTHHGSSKNPRSSRCRNACEPESPAPNPPGSRRISPKRKEHHCRPAVVCRRTGFSVSSPITSPKPAAASSPRDRSLGRMAGNHGIIPLVNQMQRRGIQPLAHARGADLHQPCSSAHAHQFRPGYTAFERGWAKTPVRPTPVTRCASSTAINSISTPCRMPSAPMTESIADLADYCAIRDSSYYDGIIKASLMRRTASTCCAAGQPDPGFVFSELRPRNRDNHHLRRDQLPPRRNTAKLQRSISQGVAPGHRTGRTG